MKGCPNFTQCPSSPSVRPSSPSTADTVSKRRRTRVSMMAAISLQALFVPCSILRPHIHLETQQEFLNHEARIIVSIQQKRPSSETFSHFCRISRGRFECRDSFPHYIRCPERGNSFSPFLRKRRKGRRGEEGPSKGKGPLHNLGRGFKNRYPSSFVAL